MPWGVAAEAEAAARARFAFVAIAPGEPTAVTITDGSFHVPIGP